MNNLLKYKYIENLIPIDQYLNQNQNSITFENSNIHLCIYNIFISTTAFNQHPPFLQYLLEKNNNKELTFPILIIPRLSSTLKREKLDILIKSFFKILFQKDNITFSLDGFYKDFFSNDLFLFINIFECNLNNPLLFLTTIHEIVNSKKIGNILINKNVSQFFIRNNDLIFLKNKININYEIPMIGYVCKPYSKLEYSFVFGLEKNNYFYDFEKAFQDCLLLKDEKKGIIRFALFLGKIKIMESILDEKELFIQNDYFDTIQINTPDKLYFIKNSNHQIPLSFQIINE